MSHFHQPGWAMPNGHIVRSHMEAAVCEYLSAAVEPHVHGTQKAISFEVTIGPHQQALFVPSIILTHSLKDGATILVEPIDSIHPGGGLRRLQHFRYKHRPDYYLILIARRVLQHDIPEDAYDLLLPLEGFTGPLDDFLREL